MSIESCRLEERVPAVCAKDWLGGFVAKPGMGGRRLWHPDPIFGPTEDEPVSSIGPGIETRGIAFIEMTSSGGSVGKHWG